MTDWKTIKHESYLADLAKARATEREKVLSEVEEAYSEFCFEYDVPQETVFLVKIRSMKERSFMKNQNELQAWKLLEVQKILSNTGFDDRKKLMAIDVIINSEIILDGRYASTKLNQLKGEE